MRFKCSLSSGIPVYGQNLVWRSLGQVTSQHATPSCRQLVWRKVFELNWFHLNCNPKYTKNIMILISNAWTEWCWSTHTFEDQNWYPLQSRKLQFKDEFTETCPLAAWSIVMFQCRLQSSKFLQWHSSVGQFQLSFTSGVPVYPAWFSGSPSGIPVYTGSTSMESH